MDIAPKTNPLGPRPLWIPAGLDFATLDPRLQKAILEIVDPCYEELVLQAATALERSSGLTYVHVLWLELIDALDLNKDLAVTLPQGEGLGPYEPQMGRYLRLIAQKDKLGKFLLEVQKFFERAGPRDPLKHLPR